MPHLRMDADDDPWLVQLRPVCLALPESTEVEAWGRPTFRAGKMFAIYEGTDERPATVAVKPDPAEREALLADPRYFLPAYHGAAGWISYDFLHGSVDWAEVAELIETSYRQIAQKRMLRALDGC